MAFGGSNDQSATGGAAGAAGGIFGAITGGPIGQAIGNALGNAVDGFLGALGIGPGPSRWADAGAGVHEWFTRYGPQDFLDWLQANYPDKFGSVDIVKGMFACWNFITTGNIVHRGDPNFFGPLTRDAYAAMGVDYNRTCQVLDNPATAAADPDGNPYKNARGKGYVVMGAGMGTPQIPVPAVNAMNNAVQAQDAGKPLTPSQQAIINDLERVTGPGTKTANMGVVLGVILLLLWLGNRS